MLVNKQKGTVLIITLLIVSVIAGLAISFTSEFQLSMTRAELRLFTGQLNQALYGTERAAAWGLREDLQEDGNKHGSNAKFDHLDENWGKFNGVSVPLNEFTITPVVLDAQGRFNINLLEKKVNPSKANGLFQEKYTEEQKMFIRLLQTQADNPISSQEAQDITQAVIDWIDADDNVTGTGGAESSYYLSTDEPYQAANQLFTSVTELLLIKGMTKALYNHLVPLVIALPDSTVGINIQTASSEVLQSINESTVEIPLDKADADSLQSAFPIAGQSEDLTGESNDGFKNVGEFFNSSEFQQVFGADSSLWPLEDGLTTGSDFFILNALVEVEGSDVQRQGTSLLKRYKDKDGTIQVRVVRRGSSNIL